VASPVEASLPSAGCWRMRAPCRLGCGDCSGRRTAHQALGRTQRAALLPQLQVHTLELRLHGWGL
jgi:hypothetical protein